MVPEITYMECDDESRSICHERSETDRNQQHHHSEVRDGCPYADTAESQELPNLIHGRGWGSLNP